jgi:hypothetical protein
MYKMKKYTKRYSIKSNSGSKGQSFVELSIVVLLLMLLVAGIAEFGVLLNRYLNLLDGVREAARYGANYDPFAPCVSGGTLDADGICSEYYTNVAKEAVDVVSPIILVPASKDDIVASVFVLANNHFCRFPSGSEDGWSWRKNIQGFSVDNHTSVQSSASIQAQMDPSAPDVSVLLVEIFYNYPQTLKAPFYEQFFPDPIPVYTYSVMPLKNVSPPHGDCYVPPP